MRNFSDFTEKDYQSYINLLRLAFDAVLNAETLEDAKRKAAWASVGQIHSGYGAFEIVQAQKQIDELTDSLAESRRREELLRAVAGDCIALLDQIIGWRIGIMGEFGEVYSGSVSRKLIDEMYLKAVAAIDGGALSSQWQQVTGKILDERHELWQQMADSDGGPMEEGE